MKIFRISTHDKTLQFTENSKNDIIYKNKEKLLNVKCQIDTVDSNQQYQFDI